MCPPVIQGSPDLYVFVMRKVLERKGYEEILGNNR